VVGWVALIVFGMMQNQLVDDWQSQARMAIKNRCLKIQAAVF
jgi:hypothetical protein